MTRPSEPDPFSPTNHRDPRDEQQPGPACPHCGGGPIVATPLGMACDSCARIVAPVRPRT
jgi:hypothetical protein